MVRTDGFQYKLRRLRRKLVIYLQYRHFGRLRRVRDRYLQLMLDCLTGSIYEDPPLKALGSDTFDKTLREYGWDWPSVAHSMIGRRRMANLRLLAEEALFNRVAGDFIETGVWRGGACIYLRAVLEAYGVKDRKVWAADSFEGLPPPDAAYPADSGDTFHTYSELAVPLETVRHNFERYGLLDGQVVFLKGWFKDTLPGAQTGPLAILRMDGDMYESTMDALSHLYDRVSVGGYVIVDDYRVVEGCRKAVDEFRSRRNIDDEIIEIDGVGVYWQKTGL
ncbi:MAG: TylF/MycF family methyltransferase [Denitratisoma sp.]|nr:TylF/MycF family methyltransferase [Denitratisoma sp.]